MKCRTCGLEIDESRIVGPTRCKCGTWFDLPEWKFGYHRERDKLRPPRNAWRPLHRYPVRNRDAWNPAAAAEWYASTWFPRIPKMLCNCAEKWGAIVSSDPPRFDTADAFELWAWRTHNKVREQLGAPPIDWDVARMIARRPVVGILSTTYQPTGGTETFHRLLTRELKKLGRVWVDGFAVTGDWHSGDPALLDVPTYGIGLEAAQTLAARCDVLICWGIDRLEPFLSDPAPKIIGTHHSDLFSDWSHGTITKNAPHVSKCVAVHPDITADLVGVPVVHIANAVDPLRAAGNPAGLRERWNISADAFVHFFCHRFSSEKRPQLAIEIARHLPAGHVLVLAGDGAERPAVEAAAAELPNVRYVGRLETPADWLATSAAFLSLATFEGFGLAIAEAMLSGVPVVSTRTGVAAVPGLALTLKADAPPAQWAAALVAAAGIDPTYAREYISANYGAEDWAAKWSDVILETAGDW